MGGPAGGLLSHPSGLQAEEGLGARHACSSSRPLDGDRMNGNQACAKAGEPARGTERFGQKDTPCQLRGPPPKPRFSQLRPAPLTAQTPSRCGADLLRHPGGKPLSSDGRGDQGFLTLRPPPTSRLRPADRTASRGCWRASSWSSRARPGCAPSSGAPAFQLHRPRDKVTP